MVLAAAACSGGETASIEYEAPASTAAPATTVAAAVDESVFSLSVGDCFDNQPNDGEVEHVPLVECAETHDNEVYFLFDMADGVFPGLDTIEEAAAETCLAEFEGYVGEPFETSILGAWPLFPTADSWEVGDRQVICVLNDFNDGTMTGSMKDAGV